jgi:hypothetical protein
VNWAVSLAIALHKLPRLDLSGGVPEALRTLVVVPCMFSGSAEIEQLLAALSTVLNGAPPQQRFQREPKFSARQLLLQEKLRATASVDAAALHARRRPQPCPDPAVRAPAAAAGTGAALGN